MSRPKAGALAAPAKAVRCATLAAERAGLTRELVRDHAEARQLAAAGGPGDGAVARLADMAERTRRAEGRLAEIADREASGSDASAVAAGAGAESDLRRRVHRYAEERMAAGSGVDLIGALVAQGFSAREVETDLKRRGVTIDPPTIARKVAAIADANLPRASASVVRPGSSRPRNTKGRPNPDAQPGPDP